MQQRGSARIVRLALAVVVAGIGAVLVLLGVSAVLRAPGGPAGPRVVEAPTGDTRASPVPPTTSPPAAVPSSPAGSDPVLLGAGDIGRCDSTADEETASLVKRLPGVVFTLGDNAYERGTPDEYRGCFGPSWGAFKDRIAFPVPGNHDWETKDAAGYRDYFGAAAVHDGQTWYSADVGAWHVVVLDSSCDKVDGGC